MRRAYKDPASKIITEGLSYKSNSNNKKISAILLAEQKGYCGYTDEYISRTDARDIDHFNPNLKDTIDDNYNNWFITKHQWNKEKSNKWQIPMLHPTADDFEERVVYVQGDYMAKSSEDKEANNLIKLLQLNDLILAKSRKKYIQRIREDIALLGEGANTYFENLIEKERIELISYPRAIKEEFDIDIWQML